jgi:Fungal specific transcription factor domain
MATKIEIRFVPGRLESTTRRDYEIQLSNIRSHAGRVSHARKRKQIISGSDKVNARMFENSKRSESGFQTANSAISKTLLSTFDEKGFNHWTDLLAQEWAIGTSWQWSKGARVDPFNCLPLRGDVTAQGALDFMGVTKWCWPSHSCINDTLNLKSQFDGRWLLEQMATNQMLFHVVVAQMEACRSLLASQDMFFPSESRLYMRKAILSLQQELSDPSNGVTDAMIATSAYLFLYEASVGDWKAAMFHRAQIGNLIARKGGMEYLPKGSAIRTMVIL